MDEQNTLPPCPKCGSPLVKAQTKGGKTLIRCSTNQWDPGTRQATGCDYVEWPKTESTELEEDCPKCGSKLIQITTTTGKKMKKCSTATWDRETRTAGGCDYVEWLKQA